jgi:hypothetical protein
MIWMKTSLMPSFTASFPTLFPTYVQPFLLRSLTIAQMETREIDNISASIAITMVMDHPDAGIIAMKLLVSNLHKETHHVFSEVFAQMHTHGLVSDEHAKIVCDHASALNACIKHNRDFDFDYFGFKTLTKSYLKQINGKIVERPQYMYLRIALHLYKNDISQVIHCYNELSLHRISHGTPTMYNACTPRSQMASCFLLAIKDDSIKGIFNTVSDCAEISKYAGGIGLSVHEVPYVTPYTDAPDSRQGISHPRHGWCIEWHCAHVASV